MKDACQRPHAAQPNVQVPLRRATVSEWPRHYGPTATLARLKGTRRQGKRQLYGIGVSRGTAGFEMCESMHDTYCE